MLSNVPTWSLFPSASELYPGTYTVCSYHTSSVSYLEQSPQFLMPSVKNIGFLILWNDHQSGPTRCSS